MHLGTGRSGWKRWILAITLLLAGVLTPVLAAADDLIVDDKTYRVEEDINFDNEYVGNRSTGTMNQTSYDNSVKSDLVLGNYSGGQGTYNLGGLGCLIVGGSEVIGFKGKGTFNQDSGFNLVSGNLALGKNTSSNGTYNLENGILEVKGYEEIAYNGNGNFIQSGGTNSVGTLYMNTGGGSAVYELSGGDLKAHTENIICTYGSARFTQSGGTNTVTGNLVVTGMDYYGDRAYYELKDGKLSVSGNEEIGRTGYGNLGTFTQSGGIHSVAGALTLKAPQGWATNFKLEGGSLDAETINLNSYCFFYQTGGSLNAHVFNQWGGEVTGTSTLENRGTFNYFSGNFKGRLLNYGVINLNANFTAGNGLANYSATTLDIAAGRSVTLNGQGLSNDGIINLAGNLRATSESIGVSSSGSFIQEGGSNTVTGDLKLGVNLPGSGAYDLKSGSLSAANELIGWDGSGAFTQTGGINRLAGDLILGKYGSGTYTLSGTGSLQAVNETIGGSLGSGRFTQSGGANVVTGALNLTGSRSRYDLDGGSLTAGTINLDTGGIFNQTGGEFAFTTFNQTGGSAAYAKLNLGGEVRDLNTYNLEGGSVSGSWEIIGNSGVGSFNQTGGTHIAKEIDLGLMSSGYGAYDLGGAGSLSTKTEYIGCSGSGDFTQSGGDHTVENAIFLGDKSGSQGAYNLSGGNLTANNSIVGYSGAGSFIQSGGSHRAISGLVLGDSSDGSGFYDLRNGALRVDGTETIGYFGNGSGSFIHRNGEHTVAGDLVLGFGGKASGSYLLCGDGQLSAQNEIIGDYGMGAFTQSSGVNSVTGTLTLAARSGSSGSGTYDLQGGILTTGTVEVKAGGTFTQNGGTWQSGDLTNFGSANLSGGTTTITGNSLNQGTIRVTNTTVTWGGSFINSGAYISDPSTQTFNDLTVEATGYLVGGAGDTFIITEDFLNFSSQNTSWDTTQALLQFISGVDTDHIFYLAGKDGAGYAHNFTWGALELAAGNSLDLDGPEGYALYVGLLLGFDVTNPNIAGNGLNIYYDPNLDGNKYLNDLTYDLPSGGHVMPTPLPGTVWLLLSGLAGLGLLDRGRLKQNLSTQNRKPKTQNSIGGWQRALWILVLGLAVALAPGLSLADDLVVDGRTYTVEENVSFDHEYIGQNGAGTMTQNDFTNTITYTMGTGSLVLGQNAGSSGTYNLSGNGSISTDQAVIGASGSGNFQQNGGALTVNGDEYIGQGGTGSFTQEGGNHTINGNFYMANNPGGSGAYDLSGGTFTAGSQEYIGHGGSATITQTGGEYNTDMQYLGHSSSGTFNHSNGHHGVSYYLSLGTTAGGHGTYNLSDTGVLHAEVNEYVGESGRGDFIQTGGTHLMDSLLCLGRNSGAAGAYNLQGGNLSASAGYSLSEYIGDSGCGSFTQSGGDNTVKDLYLGYDSGGNGTYELSGTGHLTAQNEYVGYSGSGAFSHSAGWNVVSATLTIAAKAGSKGIYELNGTGDLTASTINLNDGGEFTMSGAYSKLNFTTYNQTGGSASFAGEFNLSGSQVCNLSGGSLTAETEYINNAEHGSFIQSGGTHTVGYAIFLGDNAGESGAYRLSGGDLKPWLVYIGNNGTGTFTQTGGAHTVGDGLYLGYVAGSIGSYELNGTGQLMAKNEYIGSSYHDWVPHSGTGSFTQNGGANSVSGDMFVGYDGTGTYDLITGSLTATNVQIGGTGHGAFTQSGGAHAVTTMLIEGQSGGSGRYDLSGNYSQLTAGTVNVNAGGTFNQTGGVFNFTNFNQTGGSVSCPWETIGNSGSNGIFTQSGGTNTVKYQLEVGYNSGSYKLSGTGELTVNEESIGFLGDGSFTQSGGSHKINLDLSVGASTGYRGVYELQGGTLWVGENGVGIGVSGPGSFIQSGGGHTVAGDLVLGDGDSGSYTLSGTGQLSTQNEYIGNDSTGTFTQTGGIHAVDGALTLAVNPGSSGTYNLEGGTLSAGTIDINAGGKFNVKNAVCTVTGNVVNTGVVKTASSTVTWTGAFTNSGAYLSDPSTQTFDDLTVEAAGYLAGGAGNTFVITDDFLNYSTRNAAWDTTQALLQFVTGMDTYHTFYLAGRDQAGYANNFAWGSLELAEGNTLSLTGLDEGYALYVGLLLGFDIDDVNITGNGLNIYYDPTLPGNAYLKGLPYDLTNGGHLMPTPLPGSVWLFLSGLAGLGLLGRGRSKQG